MPGVDLIDEWFVAADRLTVRAALLGRGGLTSWFRGVTFTPYADRGIEGVRWRVDGDLVGTAEAWLERFRDGTIVHIYVRADPGGKVGSPRAVHRWAIRRYVIPLKRRMLALKDHLEGERPPGEPRIRPSVRVVSPSETAVTGEGAAGHGRPDVLQHPDRG